MKLPFFNKKAKPFTFQEETKNLILMNGWRIWVMRDKDGKVKEYYGRNFK